MRQQRLIVGPGAICIVGPVYERMLQVPKVCLKLCQRLCVWCIIGITLTLIVSLYSRRASSRAFLLSFSISLQHLTLTIGNTQTATMLTCVLGVPELHRYAIGLPMKSPLPSQNEANNCKTFVRHFRLRSWKPLTMAMLNLQKTAV